MARRTERIAALYAGLMAIVLLSRAAAAPPAEGPPRGEPRPNFVFVYTDDQRWDALGVVQREQGEKARFPWLRTPNLDRLAAEGVRFRNAFVVNSLCSPSRASFLTGMYGHLNGIVNNHTPFSETSVTHATLLRAAGYRTGYIGKWHMGPQRGPRPGFDFSASFVGQGRYFDCPFEVNGVEAPTRGWVDDVSTDHALRFLRENRERPFLLVVGFKSAHGPFEPPERLKDAYAGESARPVPNLDVPPGYAQDASNSFALRPTGAGPTNLNYFRCLSAADENLGRILKELDDLHLADDTMLVFASDNGFYLGEHRLGDKRSAYEESLRVPLLVRFPRLGLVNRTIDRMVLNIDLAPTLLDYAGVAVPAAMQGRSWRPLFEGREGDWRKAFFYAYFYENGFRIPTVTALRTETAKLIRYPGNEPWTEVFDLRDDPYELRNLAASPAHSGLRSELEAEYARRKEAIGWRVPEFADDPKSDGPKPGRNDWVLDYRFDQDEGDRVVDASRFGNHGRADATPIAPGRDMKKARRFDGKGLIAVEKSPSLDPAVAGWTVEVACRAEADQGVILAHGGETNGYILHLEDGRPILTVTVRNRRTRIAGQTPVRGRWATLTVRIRPDGAVTLNVDGKADAAGRLADPMRAPNDALQIGADLGSQVLGSARPRFVGLMESVRIHSGVAP